MSKAPATPDVWTTRTLLAWMKDAFARADLDSPQLMGEMLVSHVLGCDRLKLYLDPDRPASLLERQAMRELARRALRHEPVQYLVGEAYFFGVRLKVDRRVLIPRPCTQGIVEAVLQHHRATHGPSRTALDAPTLIADVCTGSGAIAIALAKHMPGARVLATDIARDALDVAKENATTHKVQDRVELLQGDCLAPLLAHTLTSAGCAINYLVSNPPYIPDDEWPDKVDRNVRDHEPHVALRGGADGLALVRPIILGAGALLASGGFMMVEVADARADEALAIAQSSDALKDASIVKDVEGLKRFVRALRA